MPFRSSTIAERRKFYREEFSLSAVKRWFRDCALTLPQICALDAGTETNIILNPALKNTLLYFPFEELRQKIKQYAPEDIYYDRAYYADPLRILATLRFQKALSQELVFDVDADNIPCRYHNRKKICEHCIAQVYKAALAIIDNLKHRFKTIALVYSGRGFHIHVLDREAFFLSHDERRRLTQNFSRYPIDPWVSEGKIHLIRMPYSLNALVSRRVTPLGTKNIFIENKTIPRFLAV